MSSSTPLPPGLNSEASDGVRGSYGSVAQDGYGATHTPRQELADAGSQSNRPYLPEQAPQQQPFSLFRLDMPAGQLFYQPQPFVMPQSFSQQAPPFTAQGPPPLTPETSDARSLRKTKGHVASACVPCKKAHLRCDSQRPCSRCISNGKEDACIDVQHKKRGRPRLRDERETRFEGVTSTYGTQQPDHAMRRPAQFYSPREPTISTSFADSLQRSGSYRVLKSQSTSSSQPVSGSMSQPYVDHTVHNSNIYATPSQTMPGITTSQEPAYAFLNFEFRIVKTSTMFQDAIGVPSLPSRRLQEILVGSDMERASHILKSLEHERREQEPGYLPPIYTKPEDDRVIQTVGFGQDELSRISLDKQETLTFLGADNRHRRFHVRMGVARKESTYFIAMSLVMPPAQQQYAHTPQNARDNFPREQQFGFTATAPGYVQQAGPHPFSQPQQSYGSSMTGYAPPGAVAHTSQNTQYVPGPRQTYSESQPQYYPVPHSQAYSGAHQPHAHQLAPQSMQQQYSRHQPQTQFSNAPAETRAGQGQRQRDLQLPPIREPTVENNSESRSKDDRSGRLDIGGLIDKPDSSRR